MKIRSVISIVVLFLTAALSAPVFASAVSFDSDVLFSRQNLNRNLDTGEYDFAGQNSRYGSKFKDNWKFTVAEDSTASISIFDVDLNFSQAKTIRPKNLRQLRQFRGKIDTAKIFDTKNLSISLFDNRGKLMGQADENGTISGLNLLAGKWYTIQVSGKVNGFFGSSYRGVLNINPTLTPVPLGDTAPMLGSALALLALRLRKQFVGAA